MLNGAIKRHLSCGAPLAPIELNNQYNTRRDLDLFGMWSSAVPLEKLQWKQHYPSENVHVNVTMQKPFIINLGRL